MINIDFMIILYFYYFALVFDIIFIILDIIGYFICRRREKNKKISENTRICFDCDNHYSPCKGELPFLYCPYCGKKTFGFDNESFERFEIEFENLKNSEKIKNKESLELIDKFILILQQFKIDLESGDLDE